MSSACRMPLIDFIKMDLDQDAFMEQILEDPEHVTAFLKQHISQKHILLWTLHFSQWRNENITQAFECLTQEAGAAEKGSERGKLIY